MNRVCIRNRFSERKGRKGFAKCAEKSKKNAWLSDFLLRLLRNLCTFCVEKSPRTPTTIRSKS